MNTRLRITFQLHMARYKFYIVLYCIVLYIRPELCNLHVNMYSLFKNCFKNSDAAGTINSMQQNSCLRCQSVMCKINTARCNLQTISLHTLDNKWTGNGRKRLLRTQRTSQSLIWIIGVLYVNWNRSQQCTHIYNYIARHLMVLPIHVNA